MAAPTPKDPSERRNRVAPARGEWIDIDVKRLAKPAHVPVVHRKPFVPWSRESRDRWEEWTCDPASQFWTDGDRAFALDLLEIYETEGLDSKNLPVLMRGLDKLGLTPKGKRDLRYRIAFTPYKEATKRKPAPDDSSNVVNLDERRTGLIA